MRCFLFLVWFWFLSFPRYLATTSADATVKIWKTSDFSQVAELKDDKQRWVWDCAFSGDSQYVITGKGRWSRSIRSSISEASLFCCKNFQIRYSLTTTRVWFLRVDLLECLLRFIYCRCQFFMKYNKVGGQVVNSNAWLIRVFFLFFSASSDNMARLWNIETGDVKREYSGHQKAVVALAFRDDMPQWGIGLFIGVDRMMRCVWRLRMDISVLWNSLSVICERTIDSYFQCQASYCISS